MQLFLYQPHSSTEPLGVQIFFQPVKALETNSRWQAEMIEHHADGPGLALTVNILKNSPLFVMASSSSCFHSSNHSGFDDKDAIS